MKVIGIVILSLILVANSNAQNRNKDEINFCLVLGKSIQNPFQGIGICDTSSMLQCIIQLKKGAVDTTHIGFDKYGRINYLRNFYEVSQIEYDISGITKRIRRNPDPYCTDTIVYHYQYNKDGLIGSIKETCGNAVREYVLKHIPLTMGRMIETYHNGKYIGSDLFLYDKQGSFFQWETTYNKLVTLNYKRDEYKILARLENIIKYNEVRIEGANLNHNHLEYELVDSSGNVIGSIKIKK